MSINRSIADLLRSHGTIPTAAAAPPSVIINGGMDVWQKSGASGAWGGSANMPDAYNSTVGFTGSGAATVERSTDVPTDEAFTYSCKLTCTGVNSLSSTSRVGYEQKIETQNCQELIDQISKSGGDSVTASFWMKFDKHASSSISFPATFSCNLRSAYDTTWPTYCKEFTITADDTWQKITLTYPAEAQTWKTNGVNGVGMILQVMLGVGSGKTVTLNSWENAVNDGVGSANNVNAFDYVGNIVYLTGFRLERGTTASDWQQEDYGTTLQKCMRYYQAIEGQNAMPWTVVCDSATSGYAYWRLPVTMRASPTMTINDGGGDIVYVANADRFSSYGTPHAYNGNSGYESFTLSGATAGYAGRWELGSSGSSYFRWSAEL